MIHWLKYFLVGVEETATQAVDTLSKIISLKADIEHTIHEKMRRRSTSGMKLLNYLFRSPAVTTKFVEVKCDLSKKAANDLIEAFENEGLLKKVGTN